jgi:2-octaprenyl-6-methoxyphenol hydroxylase
MSICIIGNSLSALTLAKALVNHNITVDVMFNKENLNISKTRTIGISKSNTDYLNKDIINIDKLLWKIKKIEIFSDNLMKQKLIDFKKGHEHIFSIVKNYELYQILENHLSKNKYFKLKYFNDKNLSFINNYDLIVNCDSSNAITKKYFSKKLVKNYNSNAYTTIISHEKIVNDTAVQIFTNNGPLAFLPISNFKTSIVYSIPVSMNQNKSDIEKLIHDRNFKYKIKKIEKINSFELKSLNLRNYYYNNILAFGDMLHKIHPLAGQGFNMTIRDIKILVNIIKNKFELGLPIDKSVNIEFQNDVKHKNLIFSNGVDLIYEFFNIERNLKSKYLSQSIQLISKYPNINKIFKKIADKGILI